MINDLPEHAGIYCCTHVASGQQYIGRSVSIRVRVKKHLSELRRGCHHSLHFQRSWEKYGADAFIWEVLAVLPADHHQLVAAEQQYLSTYHPALNVSTVAEGIDVSSVGRQRIGERSRRYFATHPDAPHRIDRWNRGKRQTPERIALRVVKIRGRHHTPEAKAKIGMRNHERLAGLGQPDHLVDVWTGQHHSDHTKAQMSRSRTGVAKSPAHKAAIGAGNRKAFLDDPMTRERMSAAGKARMCDPKQQAIARENIKATKTPEAIAKMAAAKRGKSPSPETRARRAASMRAAWERRRQQMEDAHGQTE